MFVNNPDTNFIPGMSEWASCRYSQWPIRQGSHGTLDKLMQVLYTSSGYCLQWRNSTVKFTVNSSLRNRTK